MRVLRSACFTLSVSLCRLVVARVPYRWIRSFRIALRTPFVESDWHAADMRKEFSHGKEDSGEADNGASRAIRLKEVDCVVAAYVDGLGKRGVRHRRRAQHNVGPGQGHAGRRGL